MFTVQFKPSFVRKYKKLPPDLQEDVKKSIELLKNNPTHPFLKSHRLKGRLENRWSCSINYKYRIIFRYESETNILLLTVGDHDIYKT